MPPKAAPAKGKAAPSKSQPGSGNNSKSGSKSNSRTSSPAREPAIPAAKSEEPGPTTEEEEVKREKKKGPRVELVPPVSPEEWDTFTKHYGLDKDGLKDLENQFMLFTPTKSLDGVITADDLLAALQNVGSDVTAEEVKEMIQDADFDSNGEVEFNEFCLMICQRQKEEKQRKKDIRRQSALHPSLSDADDLLAQIQATLAGADDMLNAKKKAVKKTVGLWRKGGE
jgi:hypothetical protein